MTSSLSVQFVDLQAQRARLAREIDEATHRVLDRSWFVLGCFSFYPSKNLGACGDAGAVVTSNPQMAARLRRLGNYGESNRYHHESMGYNSRLDEIRGTEQLVYVSKCANPFGGRPC